MRWFLKLFLYVLTVVYCNMRKGAYSCYLDNAFARLQGYGVYCMDDTLSLRLTLGFSLQVPGRQGAGGLEKAVHYRRQRRWLHHARLPRLQVRSIYCHRRISTGMYVQLNL